MCNFSILDLIFQLCNVLEMIWTSTGIAIHQYLLQKRLTLTELFDGDNDLAKVWLLFFSGFFDMQFSNLYLAPLSDRREKKLCQSCSSFSCWAQELLRTVCSVNLTEKGHYFAFDEALEFFEVKYVKQNIKKVGTLSFR